MFWWCTMRFFKCKIHAMLNKGLGESNEYINRDCSLLKYLSTGGPKLPLKELELHLKPHS